MPRWLLAITLSLLLTPSAEAGRNKKRKTSSTPDLSTAMDWLSVNEGLNIRDGFDTDPSAYIGRFLKPPHTGTLRETDAMELSCSAYITHEVVGGGDVEYSEFFRADREAQARLAVPPAFRVDAEAERTAVMRVSYTLTNKMRYLIEDAAGFEACCRSAPDQCTDLFVGEFLEGTGEVSYAVGSTAEVDAQGLSPAVMGSLTAAGGRYWKASRTFSSPVYFAFLTTDNIHAPLVLPSGSCDEVTWDDEIPASSQGHYFIGISEQHSSEQAARSGARTDAKAQAVRWLSEAIETGSYQEADTTGSDGVQERTSEGYDHTRTAADAVTEHIKDEAWCTDITPTAAGDRYRVKVAMFFPLEDSAP